MSSTLNTLDGLIARMSLADRIKEAMGEKSPADIARATGKTPGAVSQWLDGQTKSLKAETAALLESATGYRAGWIATGKGEKRIHVASSIQPGNFGTPAAIQTDPPLVIPQYAAGGGMGRGFNLTDNPPGHIKSWHVDHEWLRLNVPVHTGLRNLAIVTGFGPSMRPMFNPGDPLLVDTGVKVIDHEGVYFFRVGEEGFIKLIQRVPEFDGPGVILRVISKNPDFPPYDISPKNPHFEVLGKVLTIWRSEHF